ncbi:MAG: hypothetical protein MZV65_19675 [Chromatiales bacterium]|nr:hypothetical protein [Chromatiales bacterium]
MKVPDIKKFVIIAAPHTTNWDFPITLAMYLRFKDKNLLDGQGRHFPLAFWLSSARWLGGIPIDRSQSQNVVEQSIQAFKERDNLIMVILLRDHAKRSATGKPVFITLPKGPTFLLCWDFSTTGAK